MAAYASLTSLMQIIDQLQHHPSPPISLDKQQAESLTAIVIFLQEFLEGYNSPYHYSDQADPLEIRIARAAYAAEDVIESYIVDAINKNVVSVSQDGEEISCTDLYEDLRQVIGETDMIKKEVMGLTTEKTVVQAQQINISASVGSSRSSSTEQNHISCTDLYEDLHQVIGEIDMIKKEVMGLTTEKTVVQAQQINVSASVGSSRSSSSVQNHIMVGFDDVFLEIMDKLTAGRLDRQIIPIVGMGGIGKTTLTRNIYAQPFIKERFDLCAWATISQHFNTREILCELLSQANKKSKDQLSGMSEYELGSALRKYLFNRRFLVVMDDMWNIEAWEKIQCFFPENYNCSRIVVTTRLSKLGSQLDNNYSLEMRFLDEVSSWKLFLRIVFGEESCPLELREIGKKIVENCRGLPLSIVVMGGLLGKLEHTRECWESVRIDSISSRVNSDNEGFCTKILRMSYSHLPVYLKPCFLYMGVFEEDHAIRVSTLIKLWVSEGFLKPISGKSLETTAKDYLKDLIDRNLVLVHELGSTRNIKYCKIHDLLRDLCWREAKKEGFYNVMGQRNFQGSNSQRCVAIPGNTSKNEVHNALQSMSLARSVICDNKEVQPLPHLKLLRTLKTYDRDSYGGQDYLFGELFRFVNSRYLAVGVRHDSDYLSYSLHLLWNLQTLIICHSRFGPVNLEIRNMPKLRHVEFHKGEMCLQGIGLYGDVNLQTLKGVCGWNLRYIPSVLFNIKKLGVADGIIPNLQLSSKLESFRCWNLRHFSNNIDRYAFPHSLKKLSLGSYASHWKVEKKMLEIIGALPLLQKLRLERADFSEMEWGTTEGQFPSLKFLELKWCHLESWETESSHFPCLEQLRLYGLRNLTEIPSDMGEIPTLQSILVEYCSESVVKSAKKMAEEQEELQVRVVLFSKNQAFRSLASPNFLVEITDF